MKIYNRKSKCVCLLFYSPNLMTYIYENKLAYCVISKTYEYTFCL